MELVVHPCDAIQQQCAVFIVLILLVGLDRERIALGLGDCKDVCRQVALGRGHPVAVDALHQVLILLNAVEYFLAFHQQELVQGGDVGGAQLVAPDDASQRGHRHGLEGFGFGKALLDEFGDFLVKLLAVPLADVLGNLLDGVFAVAPAGKAVAVALIDHRLEVVEQGADVRALLLAGSCLDARDDVGHVVLRDAALRNAVAHQRIDEQLSVIAAFQRLVNVGKRFLAHVLREIEVNYLLAAQRMEWECHNH